MLLLPSPHLAAEELRGIETACPSVTNVNQLPKRLHGVVLSTQQPWPASSKLPSLTFGPYSRMEFLFECLGTSRNATTLRQKHMSAWTDALSEMLLLSLWTRQLIT